MAFAFSAFLGDQLRTMMGDAFYKDMSMEEKKQVVQILWVSMGEEEKKKYARKPEEQAKDEQGALDWDMQREYEQYEHGGFSDAIPSVNDIQSEAKKHPLLDEKLELTEEQRSCLWAKKQMREPGQLIGCSVCNGMCRTWCACAYSLFTVEKAKEFLLTLPKHEFEAFFAQSKERDLMRTHFKARGIKI